MRAAKDSEEICHAPSYQAAVRRRRAQWYGTGTSSRRPALHVAYGIELQGCKVTSSDFRIRSRAR
jgi:hypothetical protein